MGSRKKLSGYCLDRAVSHPNGNHFDFTLWCESSGSLYYVFWGGVFGNLNWVFS